ncbi:hypothetical protein M5D96_008305, partial [Drosophila gunungcola]
MRPSSITTLDSRLQNLDSRPPFFSLTFPFMFLLLLWFAFISFLHISCIYFNGLRARQGFCT